MAFVTELFTTRGRITGNLTRLSASARRWTREYALRRATYKELSWLSDRELDDLGIDRRDIARIATESARRA